MDPLRRETLETWAIQMQECKDSGMTQKEWCAANEININTFRYRRSALKKAADELQSESSGNAPTVQFAEVPVPAKESSPISKACEGISIEMNGSRIQIGADANKDQIQAVLEVLIHA